MSANNRERSNVTRYKYAIDDVIPLASRTINGSTGPFTVRQRHETDGGKVSYRVRCVGEPFDRVVEERQIERVIPTMHSAAGSFSEVAR